MQLVSTTGKLTFLFAFILCSAVLVAQENSPYSRYGLGNLAPNQTVYSRGMAGISAPIRDPLSVNLNNPAAYSNFFRVVYDLGLMIDSRTLRSKTPNEKYNATNFVPAYVALGIPLSQKHKLGMALGFKPYTRINYSILEAGRITNVDSVQNLYEGNGGLNQAFIGIGKKWKNFSFGINTGALFGKKENNTRRSIINTDTAFFPIYYQSNHATTTSFGSYFVSPGIQFETQLGKSKTDAVRNITSSYHLSLGAHAMLKKTLKGSQDLLRETFVQDGNGGNLRIDSIYEVKGTRVDVQVPGTYTFGFAINKIVTEKGLTGDKFIIAGEYEAADWQQYRYGGASDRTTKYWQARLGGQFRPSIASSSVLAASTYRVGFAIGQDYINADGNKLKTISSTVGMSIPIIGRGFARTQFTVLNLAAEFGRRGSNVNNITESFIRFSAGLSFSDIWFIKRKYD